MADKTSYTIELEIENSDRVASEIDGVERALKSITDDAKKLNFNGAVESAKALELQMNSIYESEEDATKAAEAFERASGKAYAELERSAVRINYALSEQGKLQRERIKELEAERASLDKTAESKARQKEIDAELRDLRKQVISASDDELNAMLQQNVAARTRLKLMQQTAKQQKTEQKQQKTLKQLIAEDLKPLKYRLLTSDVISAP